MFRAKVGRLFVQSVMPLTMVLAWEVAAREGLLPPSQSAAPSRVVVRLVSLLMERQFVIHLLYSVGRLLTGAFVGVFAGIICGLCLAHSRQADKFISPTMQFLAPIPGVVWIPFAIMFFGLGETSKVMMVGVAVFFIIQLHAFRAMKSISSDYIELAAVYEKNFREKIVEIYLPFATPAILTALRISLAVGWIVLFVVEYGYSDPRTGGLGWFISDARGLGRVEDQFAGVLLLGIVGYISDMFVAMAQRRLLVWADSFEETAL